MFRFCAFRSFVRSILSAKPTSPISPAASLRARTSEVESLLSAKPDRAELDTATNAVAHRLTADVSRAAAELRALVDERASGMRSGLASIVSKVGSYVERSEVDAALRGKADTREVELWLQSKAGVDELASQLEVLGGELTRQLETKASSASIPSTQRTPSG